jgi:hypothetical protein
MTVEVDVAIQNCSYFTEYSELGVHKPLYSISVSTFFKGHRYPLPTIGVGSIYMHIFICNVFLTTQHVPHLPLRWWWVLYIY